MKQGKMVPLFVGGILFLCGVVFAVIYKTKLSYLVYSDYNIFWMLIYFYYCRPTLYLSGSFIAVVLCKKSLIKDSIAFPKNIFAIIGYSVVTIYLIMVFLAFTTEYKSTLPYFLSLYPWVWLIPGTLLGIRYAE